MSTDLEELKQGNSDTLKRIYLTYREECLAFMNQRYKLQGNAALEAYQDVILTFHHNVLADKPTELSSNLKTYLFDIAKNLCLKKREQGNSPSHSFSPELLEGSPSPAPEKANKTVKEQMAAWEEEIPDRKPYAPYLVAAISVAVLLVGVYVFLNRNPSYAEIYVEYYKSCPNVVTQRGDESRHSTALYMDLYNLGDFPAFTRKVAEASIFNDTLTFYQALAHMQIDEHKSAQNAFEKVGPQSSFRSAAQYYRALSHIALGQKEEALAVLQTLQKNGSRSYLEKAKELSQVLTD